MHQLPEQNTGSNRNIISSIRVTTKIAYFLKGLFTGLFLPFLKEKGITPFTGRFFSKKFRYRVAAMIDICLIVVILVNGVEPAQRLMTPLLSSSNIHASLFDFSNPFEAYFSFAPGSSLQNLNMVDFGNLAYLSFFDAPILADGKLNRATDSYQTFLQTPDLAQKAHLNNTKMLLTLSQMNPQMIQDLLDNSDSQITLALEAYQEISQNGLDGVNIYLDPGQTNISNFRNKFSELVKLLAQTLHEKIPGSLIVVSIGNNPSKLSLFDLVALSQSADRIFITSSELAVPEFKNAKINAPVFGYKQADYLSDLSSAVSNFIKEVPVNKLALERAWYGNGDNYPLYIPNSTANFESLNQNTGLRLDQAMLNRLVAGVPTKAQPAARRNIPYIVKALEQEGILNNNVLAYALATIEHETDATFEPIDEIQGRRNALRLGYEGGAAYFGRGFIQLTHLRNYKLFGERIGLGDSLARNPNLASNPTIAAKILAAYFKDNDVSNRATRGDFISARWPVNPDRNAWHVAQLALKYDQ